MRPRAGHLALAGIILLLTACGGRSAPPASVSTPTAFEALPGWATEPKSVTLSVFALGCDRIADPGFAVACADAKRLKPNDEAAADDFLRTHFRPVLLGRDTVTGYFELTVAGSRTRTRRFTVPVLGNTQDAGRYTRSQILAGALAGRGLELLYLESEADLYFLQLQGAGRVVLPDGGVVRLGTVANNGRPHIPTNKLFGDAVIPNNDLSIPGLRAWAATHPAETEAHLAHDQAYVFFHETPELPPQFGPYGAFGLPLLPMRSVAVDPHTMSLGAMLWLDSTNPHDGVALPHLMLAHDTGDLITGPARTDVFFGWGEKAEQSGGRQYALGSVWALVPR